MSTKITILAIGNNKLEKMRNNNFAIKAILDIVLMAGTPLFSFGTNVVPNVEAVDQSTEYYIEITGNGVRGRMGPGLEYQDTGARFNKGQHLKAFSHRNGWYEVRWGQETVWVSGQFAKRSANQKPDKVMVSVEGPVRLRLGPGGKDSGLRVDFEDTFKYLGEQGNWYKISYKGKAYWISKDCSYAE